MTPSTFVRSSADDNDLFTNPARRTEHATTTDVAFTDPAFVAEIKAQKPTDVHHKAGSPGAVDAVFQREGNELTDAAFADPKLLETRGEVRTQVQSTMVGYQPTVEEWAEMNDSKPTRTPRASSLATSIEELPKR